MLLGDLTDEAQNVRRELERSRNEIVSLKARLTIAEAGAKELAELRDLFDEAPIAYIHEGIDTRFIRANRAAVDLLGIASDAIDGTIGMSFISLTPETQQRLRKGLNSLAAGQEASTILQLQRRNGEGPLWVQWRSRPAEDGLSTRTMLLDVTQSILAEQAKTALEFSLESGQVGDWDLDLSTDTSRRSLRHDQCFGYDEPIPESAWGKARFLEHVHPEDRTAVERSMQHAIAEEVDWSTEFRVIWPKGEVHWLVARGRIYRDAGDESRMLGIVMDITEQRRTEKALRETKAALDFALQATEVGDWDLDLNLNKSRRSLRHDQCFGYTQAVPENAWGVDAFLRHIHPEDRYRVETSMNQAIAPLQDWGAEFRVSWPDGSVHWLAARGSIYSVVEGRATRMLGIVMDITERKNAESAARLSAQSREAAVIAERNRLAREIHDTLAQGFTGVIVQLQAAEDARRHGLSNEASAHLAHAADSARYGLREARRSVHGLRPQALEGRDLASALSRMFGMMTTGTAVRAELTIQGPTEALPADCEDNLLRIVQEGLTNVIRHARATLFDAKMTFRSDGLELLLRDDGCGFDPSTRSDGFGLLGMTERVEAMGGHLIIDSVSGKGTALRIHLPPANDVGLL